jgi:hypothetical protein
MNLTQDLLYLLLLYAVLDKDRKLSLNTGLMIACGLLLFSCYQRQYCNNGTATSSVLGTAASNLFSNINGTL